MWGSIAIAFVLAFVTACAITPITIKFAKKVGAVDIPKDSRKIHAKPMPRLRRISCNFWICCFIIISFKYIKS